MLPGLMQETPLGLRLIAMRAGDQFARRTVTTKTATGFVTATYGDVIVRAGRLASSLAREFGVRVGDRVGTLAWNSQAHLEVSIAVPGMGAVLHAINARLDPKTIASLIAEADDRVVFVDRVLLDLWGQVDIPACVRAVVLLDGDGSGGEAAAGAVSARVTEGETLIAAGSVDFAWPILPENAALGLCFTSGTTGRPKGVLYSHRAIVLHSLAMLAADGIGLRERDVCLPIVQQFHANGWGFPYASLLAGASLAFAGKATDPDSLAATIAHAKVTVATAVPTVWAGLLDAVQAGRIGRDKLASLDRLPVGGAVASEKLIDGFGALGIRVMHCWGMTEISPLGTVNGGPRATLTDPAERLATRNAQGLTLPLCTIRIVDAQGGILARDGKATGELQITGPWVARGYFDAAAPELGHRPPASFVADSDGTTWLKTGDLATIDAEGYVRLVDRAKDLVKSGGEWISSVMLEAALMDHPTVLEAAVIARPHPKWDERPVAYVVSTAGADVNTADLILHLSSRFAKWQLPDCIISVAQLPKGATGKIDKRALRELDRRQHMAQEEGA